MKSQNPNVYIEASAFASSKPSGVVYAATNIIHALAISLADSNIFLLATSDTASIPEKLSQLPNISIKKLPFPARYLRLLTRFSFIFPFDLVLGRGIYIFPNFYNFPVISKSITFIYDVSFLLYPETIQPKNLKFFNDNMRKWVGRSDFIATLTETSKQEIVDHLGVAAEKIIVSPVPIGDEFHEQNDAAVENIKKQYSLPEKYILYLGNIEPRKNLASLVTAFAACKTSKSGVSLLIVGADTWKAKQIVDAIEKARSKGADIVTPSKFVENDDLPALISGADYLVQPSLHEGFGVPPTQALACGTPVLVSDIPAMHEVLSGAAQYMDPNSVADMTQKLDGMAELIMSNDFKQDQSEQAKKVLQKLEPTKTVKSLLAVTV